MMFFSSVGYSVNMHYCQGQLKSFSFIGKAKTCHDMTESSPMKNCPHHAKMLLQKKGCALNKKDCCQNKTLLIQCDVEKQVQLSGFTLGNEMQQFVLAYFTTLIFGDVLFAEETNLVAKYLPPLIARDIPVLFESFLL